MARSEFLELSDASTVPIARLVSVVTRTRGHMPFLRRCLSALRSSGQALHLQWIVVDDGSLDAAVVSDFVATASREGTLSTETIRTGASNRAAAANAGIAAATGVYLHFLDDDDVVLPGFYDQAIQMLESEPRLGAAAAKCVRVVEAASADGESFHEISRAQHYPEIKAITLASLAVTQTVPLVSVLFRRDALLETGAFDPSFAVCEDYDLLLRFLTVADIGLLRQSLVNFHQRETATGILGNSAATTDFAAENAYFRNAMLRRDLENERLGLGWLLAFGEMSGGSVKAERILTELYKNSLVRKAFSVLRR